MRIRRLQPEDAAAYRELRLRALREHPEAFTSSWEEDNAKPVEASRQRLASAQAAFWGAFDAAGALVGMVGLEQLPRPKERHKGHVVGMYVAPEAGRRGAGRALLQALLDEALAAGLTDLTLTVTEGNRTALRLYEMAGFRAFGTEPRAILVDGHPHGKVHMHRALR